MSKKIEGTITITSSGVGYFSHPDLKKDIKIEAKFLNTALNGDTVLVSPFPENKNESQRKGEVVEIMERRKTRFVGTIDKKGKNYSFLIPDDQKMYTDIFIPDPDKSIENKDKALVEMLSWDNPKKSPEGKIIKVLGKKGEERVEREAMVLESGLEVDFPKEVLKQAKKIKKNSKEKKKRAKNDRKDMRNRKTFTIDPESAKDFDDALSIKKISEDRYEVGIHIADVSFWVKEETPIDREAKKRGFSIYMVGETVPMLPEVLSNDLCSLNPNEEKLAFSIIFEMNKKGEVFNQWVGETVIESDRRYTYKEAMEKIEQGDEDLNTLNEIAKNRKEERVTNGSLKFKSDEVVFELDEDGVPLDIKLKESFETHGLIEEFMLLANRKVAGKYGGSPFVFRIHEEPDRETIQELKGYLSGMGYDVKLGDKVTSQKINDLIEEIEGKAVEFLVNNVILRSMTKAYYSTKNVGHFGLAFDKYTHFTSPIRRYADLTVHRIIKKKIKNKKLKTKSEYESVSISVSENELRALEAERESISYKKCQYMIGKEGKKRRAVISGITEWGIYVRDLDSYAEGMISLRSLEDDYYVLDKENYRLIGKRTNKEFALGDEVKVVVDRVDLEARIIDFILA